MTILYHGSGNPDLTLSDISIIGGVERKQGNRYGGFYAVDKAGYIHALSYARMQGGEPTIYEVQITDNARIWDKSGDITRLKVTDIEQWQSQGIDIVRGKDFRGQTEYAIINRDIIVGLNALALAEGRSMRDLIDMVSEGEVVSLTAARKAKNDPEQPDLRATLNDMFAQAREQYKGRKFIPMAETHIQDGLSVDTRLTFGGTVMCRDHLPSDAAKSVMRDLKRKGWVIVQPSKPRDAASRRELMANPNQDQNGPYAKTAGLTFEECRDLFSAKDTSPWGGYSPSDGFGVTGALNWDGDGLCWYLTVSGLDSDNNKWETHIIDDDEDWRELSAAIAMIRRAKMMSI